MAGHPAGGRCNRINKWLSARACLPHSPRVPAADTDPEPAKSKPAVARLPALVDAPALDHLDPAADEALVARGDKVEERAPEGVCRREQRVVGDVEHRAGEREAVEDERRALGLCGERGEADGRCG